MTLFDPLSYWNQEAKRGELPRWATVENPSPERTLTALAGKLRSWAADLNEALLDVTGTRDPGRTAATTFTEGVQRIDEIIREMDEYGTR